MSHESNISKALRYVLSSDRNAILGFPIKGIVERDRSIFFPSIDSNSRFIVLHMADDQFVHVPLDRSTGAVITEIPSTKYGFETFLKNLDNAIDDYLAATGYIYERGSWERYLWCHATGCNPR